MGTRSAEVIRVEVLMKAEPSSSRPRRGDSQGPRSGDVVPRFRARWVYNILRDRIAEQLALADAQGELKGGIEIHVVKHPVLVQKEGEPEHAVARSLATLAVTGPTRRSCGPWGRSPVIPSSALPARASSRTTWRSRSAAPAVAADTERSAVDAVATVIACKGTGRLNGQPPRPPETQSSESPRA